MEKKTGIKNRGFGSMTTEKRLLIASMGGKASHKLKKGHEWTSAEASAAAKKSAASKRKKAKDKKT